MKTIINADDFGISPGVNQAIKKLYLEKKLNSASLICTGNHIEEAINIAKDNPGLKTGLHFNLTTGISKMPHHEIPLLTDKNNRFKNGFAKILLLAIFKRKALLKQVEKELEAQIEFLKINNITLSHIDGHRHIHYIPGIFQLVVKIAGKYQIPRIRIINEDLLQTLKIKYPKIYLLNGGIIKWLVLRFLGLFNGAGSLSDNCYFFSILYSCRISKDLLSKIQVPEKFNELEIMIHPGNPDIDTHFPNLEETPHLLSKFRYSEQL